MTDGKSLKILGTVTFKFALLDKNRLTGLPSDGYTETHVVIIISSATIL